MWGWEASVPGPGRVKDPARTISCHLQPSFWDRPPSLGRATLDLWGQAARPHLPQAPHSSGAHGLLSALPRTPDQTPSGLRMCEEAPRWVGPAYLCACRTAALHSRVGPSPGGSGTGPCGCTPGGQPGIRASGPPCAVLPEPPDRGWVGCVGPPPPRFHHRCRELQPSQTLWGFLSKAGIAAGGRAV